MNTTTRPAKSILPLIVIAQFACTSLWFAGNAVVPELVEIFDYPVSSIGYITAAVQFGFIVGTLIYAIFTIADRISPSLVFFISALLAAGANSAILWGGSDYYLMLSMRFLTGFFLAGIYPVGMKIASDYYDKGLGKALGYLVGALVVGTAFPHLIKSFSTVVEWRSVLAFTSVLSVAGGALIWLGVPDGPYRKVSQKPDFTAFFKVFRNRPFRSAAFGYFGHMWELYAFWAFVPYLLQTYFYAMGISAPMNGSLAAFWVIAIGGPACAIGGWLSQRIGTKKLAFRALFLSGHCCLLSPFAFLLPFPLFFLFLLFWGMVVIVDSPLFSTLIAQSAAPETKGTALTISTCIGFAITILSIQLITFLYQEMNPRLIYVFLAIGPFFGLLALWRGDKKIG